MFAIVSGGIKRNCGFRSSAVRPSTPILCGAIFLYLEDEFQ